MKNILKVLNIIALIAVAFFVGKMILNTEKEKSDTAEDEPAAMAKEAGEVHKKDFVALDPEKLETAGIATATAGHATLHLTRSLFGQFRANEENLANIAPRFPGIIQKITKRLGDHVEKHDVLIVVESNESLEAYDVKSLISGTVIFREANRGEAVTEGQRLMTVADLSTLWVDLNAYPQDYQILKIGQPVSISASALEKPIDAKIDYISPFGTEGTQTMLARVTVPNDHSHLRPGLFAEGSVLIGQEEVSIAVENSALQTWEEKDVVFVKDEDGFQATTIELGKTDGKFTEVRSGIKAGTEYATTNSFLLKAELGKSMVEED
ncbi:MAG: efflux RND transporter periplasmic adaptor subunit [Luteolibacter sp.]